MSASAPQVALTVPKTFKLLAIYAAIGLVLWALASFLDLLMPFLVAWLLAFFLSPIIDAIEGWGLSRAMAILALFLGSALLIALVVWFFLPKLTQMVTNVQTRLPQYIGTVQHVKVQIVEVVKAQEAQRPWLKQMKFSRAMEKRLGGGPSATPEAVAERLLDSGGELLSSMQEVLEYLLLVPFLMFFFLKDGRDITKGFIRMVPNRYFEMTLSVLYECDRQVRSYFKGQLIDACIVGVLASVGLWAIGLNYAMTVGVVAGIGNIIPYVGPVVGSVIAVGVALVDAQSVALAGKAVLVMIGVQLLDETLISPLVVGHSVSLHPVLVMAGIMVGGATMGFVGMLLGVPLLAAVLVSFKILAKGFREYRLG